MPASEQPRMTGEELRRFALSLPESEEQETWGEATFRVRGKIFATLGSDGSEAGVKATLDEQDVLVTNEPDVFSVAHYVGRFGWVTVQMAAVDAQRMYDLVLEAWRRTAPKRVVRSFDDA